MMSGTAINVVRCRRRHKPETWTADEDLEDEERAECSSSNAHCSQTDSEEDEITETCPLSTRISPPLFHRQRRQTSITNGMPPEERGKGHRMKLFSMPSLPLSSGLLLLLCTLLQSCEALPELRCGPIDIRNTPDSYRPRSSWLGDPDTVDHFNKTIVDCTVIEGSFTISFIYAPLKRERPYYTNEDYPRFPNLREITGSVLIFETTGLSDLSWLFPNLRVIGGQTLIQHYALVIYRNHNLEKMGLTKLRTIRNGGVRIMDNKLLCYPKSIDWKHIITSKINDVTIDDAAEWAVQETGRICPAGPCEDDLTLPEKCHYVEQNDLRVMSCWGNKTCHKLCKYDRLAENYMQPGPGCDENGEMCHEECVGGCEVKGDATSCYACKNYYYKGKCVPKCDSHLYSLLDRRCVTKEFCLGLNPMDKTLFTKIKATNGICSDKCPPGYEQHPTNPNECRVCTGECQIVCTGNFTIDTYPKAIAIRRCNIIEGSLTLEIRGNADSGMASELNNLFAAIHTIKGYLFVMRSPPFLTLQMFRNLKLIEGQFLYNGKYAISIIENQNLRRLFDENVNVTIMRGDVQFHNNRMLCFKEIRDLMTRLGKYSQMNEADQSPSSNGDKAICEDSRIDVKLKSIGSDYFELRWPAFNTTDIDHRKFLGYEVFYKIVEEIDPEMSIDDDRSACVDSWSSMFIQHVEKENDPGNVTMEATLFTDQRIIPNTIYAYYVATQMVHHPGAKNGISRIGFVKTHYAVPDPPFVTITKVEKDSIELTWEPPHRPNGVITHYQITWREIDVDTEAVGLDFCDGDLERIYPKLLQSSFKDDPTEVIEDPDNETTNSTTTVAPSLTTMFPKPRNTCSSIAGCCACAPADAEKKLEGRAAQAEEHTQFENEIINGLFETKCDESNSSVDCLLDARGPELDEVSEDDQDEDDNDEAPELRIRRASEAFERERRRFYRRVRSIRSTGGRALQQKYKDLILSSIRTRRSIKSASELSEVADRKQQVNSRPVKTKVFMTTPAPNSLDGTTTVTILTGNDFRENGKLASPVIPKSQLLEERLIAAERREKNVTAKPGTNRYTLINLRHFTAYSISISACQNTSVFPHYCSTGMKAAKRKHTKPIYSSEMDYVHNETIHVERKNETTLHITWEAVPKNRSNGGVVGYNVYLTGIGGSGSQMKCQGASAGWSSEENGTTFYRVPDGHYRVSVKAISVLGHGPYSVLQEPVIVFTPGFWTWERIGIVATFVLCILIVIALICYYYVKRFYGQKVKAMADFMSTNPEYCVENLYKPDEWEIPLGLIALGDVIGEGSFGKVWEAECQTPFTNVKKITFTKCAVKQNQEEPASPENMNYLMEANIMKQFESNFIVKLYGVVSTINPAFVVMELMELGNLRDYLRSKRDDEVFNEMDCEYYDVIPREKFHEWAAQIADGMAYLESVKFCHRDLAARNCMINQFETVKIGDFGMARDLFYHDYYKPSGKRMMPVRWMAPESLKDGKFDSKSDAWSFGIVLYEMMTLGAQPYIGLSNDEVLNYIGMSRKVIKKPECCSAYWYKIMKMCWRYTPRERPTFAQLVHLLAQNASPDFRSLSHVINDVNAEVEALDLEDVDIFDGPTDVTPDNERRHTDSIQMRELPPTMEGVNSHSTISMNDDSARALVTSPPKRQRSLDDDYALMTHSGRVFEPNSDPEVRNLGGDGDYVERDVQIDVPTRRNTGASNSSYGAPYCLANRGNSNERAGFGEGVRLTDALGSGQLDESDYVEKDLSMDTRRSTGASTNSYGIPQTNWSSKSGPNFFNSRPQNGRGDRLTHLPGTGHLQNARGGPGGEYIESQPKNGSPSRNGNGPYCQTNRGSFNGRSTFGEHERLTEDTEHPLA